MTIDNAYLTRIQHHEYLYEIRYNNRTIALEFYDYCDLLQTTVTYTFNETFRKESVENNLLLEAIRNENMNYVIEQYDTEEKNISEVLETFFENVK